MATMDEIVDKKMTPYKFRSCFASCMFNTVGCCTPFTFTPKYTSEAKDEIVMTENTVCFCGRMSPIPCCMGCGFGPCGFAPHFKKESETRFVAEAKSVFAGGCCAGMMNNKGDVIEFKDGHWEYFAGPSMANPPCLQNTTVAEVKPVSGYPSAGAPDSAKMQR